MNAALHNPRSYLLGEDDTTTVNLGEFDADGFAGGKAFSEPELLRKLSREQRADYRQARSEGFHPVLLIDMETGVPVLEMRKHS
jgi:hypothetical protein